MTPQEQAREKAREWIWRSLVYVQSGGENTKFLGPDELTPFAKMPESQFVSMPFGKLLTALADFHLHMEGQGWHLVSDPPKRNGTYTVSCDDYAFVQAVYMDGTWRADELFKEKGVLLEYVRHWRELPPAPPDQTEEE